jgi:hypothetical protein
MAWIESHQSLLTHWKTQRLARQLGVSRITAIGHLHALWWWCLDNAPDGELDHLEDEEIAAAAEWTGDAHVFSTCMHASGFIERTDSHVLVHDWNDYAGKLIDRRKANAERMRIAREQRAVPEKKPRATHVQRTSRARAGATVPNSTQPNSTKESLTETLSQAPLNEQVQAFDRTMQAARGYQSRREFLDNVQGKYAALDLPEQALEITEWLTKHPTRTASGAFVLAWLKRSLADAAASPPPLPFVAATNGAHAVSRLSEAEKYARGVKHV